MLVAGSGMSSLGQVNTLGISGGFNPRELYIQHTINPYSHIQHLTIQDFRMCGNEVSIQNFLQGFPGLRTLSVSFQGWSPSINAFKSLHWSELEHLDIRGMWTSDSEYADILERHLPTLKVFSLHNPALTEGSWQTLFTKIRALNTQAEIVLSGELFGRTSGETINMGCEQIQCSLADFLRNRESVWPFDR
jgi:hypothetical protein